MTEQERDLDSLAKEAMHDAWVQVQVLRAHGEPAAGQALRACESIEKAQDLLARIPPTHASAPTPKRDEAGLREAVVELEADLCEANRGEPEGAIRSLRCEFIAMVRAILAARPAPSEPEGGVTEEIVETPAGAFMVRGVKPQPEAPAAPSGDLPDPASVPCEEYPSEDELRLIRAWDPNDLHRLFRFVVEHWHYADWGATVDAGDGWLRCELSTGGWSGNEDRIDALQENAMAWLLAWESSARGGHYVFAVGEAQPATPSESPLRSIDEAPKVRTWVLSLYPGKVRQIRWHEGRGWVESSHGLGHSYSAPEAWIPIPPLPPAPGGLQMNPPYYTWIPSHPCHELVPHFPFLRGNAIKYIYRAGKKDPETEIEDLEKAIHSLQMEVDKLKETKK